MSLKAARGTKRVCQSCNSKFYDLGRMPATCPICQTVFQQETGNKPVVGNAQDDEDDELIARPAGVDIVSLDEAAAEGDLPDLEDSDLVDIDDEAESSDEPFIEVEDDAEDDEVSGLVGNSRGDEEEV
jgi:uncharacterized protein (TIGR02300 family)